MINTQALIRKELESLPLFELKEKVVDGTPLTVKASWTKEQAKVLSEMHNVDIVDSVRVATAHQAIADLAEHLKKLCANAEITPVLKETAIMSTRLNTCLLQSREAQPHFLNVARQGFSSSMVYNGTLVYVDPSINLADTHVFTFEETPLLVFSAEETLGEDSLELRMEVKTVENFRPFVWNFPEHMLDSSG